MKKRVLVFMALVIVLVLTGCGGGGGGSAEESTMDGTTPVNLSDRDSIYGTYQVTFMSVSCTNGESYATTDNRVDEFSAFIGYGTSNMYRDLYLEAEGTVLMDVADIQSYDQLDNSYDSTLTQVDDYTISETVYDVPVSYYYCDYTYRYKKLSDSIISSYFRVLGSRSGVSEKGHIFVDDTENPDFTKSSFDLFKIVIE